MQSNVSAVWLLTVLISGVSVMAADRTQPQLVSEGLAGYISMDVPAPPEEYGYGVSLYSSAWPLRLGWAMADLLNAEPRAPTGRTGDDAGTKKGTP